MSELTKYINSLENLESILVEKAKQAVLKKQGFILGTVKSRLFNKGVDGDNKEITPSYKNQTIEIKKSKNQRVSHVTLRDTGEFYNSLFINTKTNDIFLDSSDDKADYLKMKYGKSIMDLTEQEQLIIIDTIIEPFLVKEIKKLDLNIDLF